MVIATLMPPSKKKGQTMRFPSTLYLSPILDLLLTEIPRKWHPELRLGLQEALVNAAKHGNKLDPNKSVFVASWITEEQYSWTIANEGSGFTPQCSYNNNPEEYLPVDESECGRGLCILNEIFDLVQWNSLGTEVRLCKQLKRGKHREPLIS